MTGGLHRLTLNRPFGTLCILDRGILHSWNERLVFLYFCRHLRDLKHTEASKASVYPAAGDMAATSSLIPKVKVYGVPYSICTSRVITCLLEKQVDYDLQIVDIAKTKDHKKPEFLKMQPFGVIPVLQDKDLSIFESRAIIRYIARKHEGHGTPLYGTSEKDKAMVDQWLEVESQNYNPAIAPAVWHLVHAPIFGQVGDPAVAQSSIEKLEKVLDVYEGVLQKSKYLAGDFFSLADLSHLPFTHYLINDGKRGDIYDKRPHVKAWWTSISTRPTWKKHLSVAFPDKKFP